MSAVPLMTLHNSKRDFEDIRDSDQNMSDEDEDPLEGVLARMKYRPQSYRSRDFWTGVLFTAVLFFVIGFVVSYTLFLTMDNKNSGALQAVQLDLNPEVASRLLRDTSASEIKKFLGLLNMSQSADKPVELLRAQRIRQHFVNLSFDTVSEVFPSQVTFSFYDESKPNVVTIVREKGENDRTMRGITNHGYLVEPDLTSGYSVHITTQSSVVYVNFGRETDFRYLKDNRADVSVTGNVVLARLGKVHPVELVHRCLQNGAAGVLLFADPQQYPKYHNATFLSPTDLGRLQSIHGNIATGGNNHSGCVPVMTISVSDAEYIFREMSSSEGSPESWRGNMTVNYPIGPGFSMTNSELRMVVNMVNVRRTLYSVTGGIRGSHEADRYVMLGSSHSSFSGRDTLGAMAAMMEMAQVLSKLNSETGWRPRRSIVFCSWGFSSSEGTVTSVHLNEDWLISMHQKAVVYLQVETLIRGNKMLNIGATPLLAQALYDAASLVPNPAPSKPRILVDSWKILSTLSDPKKLRIHNIEGEGNYQSALRDLGIPSLDLHFGNEGDSNKLKDVDFKYHRTIAQLWIVLTWKMADSLVVPYDINRYAVFLKESVNGITAMYKKEVTHSLPILELHYAVNNLSVAADAFHNRLHSDKPDPLVVRILNDQQMLLEKAFLHHHNSLKPRNSRHVLFSPGASVNVNASLGFGELQDILEELSTTPSLQQDVADYIHSLIHCISNAAHNLETSLQPPVLSVV